MQLQGVGLIIHDAGSRVVIEFPEWKESYFYERGRTRTVTWIDYFESLSLSIFKLLSVIGQCINSKFINWLSLLDGVKTYKEAVGKEVG
jgi:hypothetical protein